LVLVTLDVDAAIMIKAVRTRNKVLKAHPIPSFNMKFYDNPKTGKIMIAISGVYANEECFLNELMAPLYGSAAL